MIRQYRSSSEEETLSLDRRSPGLIAKERFGFVRREERDSRDLSTQAKVAFQHAGEASTFHCDQTTS
ncbi:hypothetical protein K0M31_010394 [Melipona bicolor]|uniref:Uncharacterized protein n=1 Tax=Melipona bicolor TaxID=60889 RepID=A0AA40FMR2_9HYME|nr:hypothetical protein K0M31_010394 [Melipona bicolor]